MVESDSRAGSELCGSWRWGARGQPGRRGALLLALERLLNGFRWTWRQREGEDVLLAALHRLHREDGARASQLAR